MQIFNWQSITVVIKEGQTWPPGAPNYDPKFWEMVLPWKYNNNLINKNEIFLHQMIKHYIMEDQAELSDSSIIVAF